MRVQRQSMVKVRDERKTQAETINDAANKVGVSSQQAAEALRMLGESMMRVSTPTSPSMRTVHDCFLGTSEVIPVDVSVTEPFISSRPVSVDSFTRGGTVDPGPDAQTGYWVNLQDTDASTERTVGSAPRREPRLSFADVLLSRLRKSQIEVVPRFGRQED